MAFEPRLVFLGGFAALMATAAFEDVRRLVIPNRVVVGLCLLWLLRLFSAQAPGPDSSLATIGGAFAVFIAGALLFSRGLIGGGDAKLLSAAALWAGAGSLPSLLLVTALLGGLLSILLLTPLGPRLAAARRGSRNPAAVRMVGPNSTPVPYGAAIAGAALIVTLSPQLG